MQVMDFRNLKSTFNDSCIFHLSQMCYLNLLELSFRERERKPRKKKETKQRKKKVPEEDDGLTAKQRRKIVSKAIISSSEGSDSEGEKLKIDDGR